MRPSGIPIPVLPPSSSRPAPPSRNTPPRPPPQVAPLHPLVPPQSALRSTFPTPQRPDAAAAIISRPMSSPLSPSCLAPTPRDGRSTLPFPAPPSSPAAPHTRGALPPLPNAAAPPARLLLPPPPPPPTPSRAPPPPLSVGARQLPVLQLPGRAAVPPPSRPLPFPAPPALSAPRVNEPQRLPPSAPLPSPASRGVAAAPKPSPATAFSARPAPGAAAPRPAAPTARPLGRAVIDNGQPLYSRGHQAPMRVDTQRANNRSAPPRATIAAAAVAPLHTSSSTSSGIAQAPLVPLDVERRRAQAEQQWTAAEAEADARLLAREEEEEAELQARVDAVFCPLEEKARGLEEEYQQLNATATADRTRVLDRMWRTSREDLNDLLTSDLADEEEDEEVLARLTAMHRRLQAMQREVEGNEESAGTHLIRAELKQHLNDAQQLNDIVRYRATSDTAELSTTREAVQRLAAAIAQVKAHEVSRVERKACEREEKKGGTGGGEATPQRPARSIDSVISQGRQEGRKGFRR